jgi:hypothetical protein
MCCEEKLPFFLISTLTSNKARAIAIINTLRSKLSSIFLIFANDFNACKGNANNANHKKIHTKRTSMTIISETQIHKLWKQTH